MPRSVADATRFTATVPHAHSKSSHIPSTSPTAPSPANRPRETPQQRVARLRAAALKAKAGKTSTVDKIVVRGRIWADRAHRFVTLSLVGLTGISAIYATVAITDMLLYNRRKKREFLSQQSHLLSISIADAAAAEALGTATEAQVALLTREREHAAYVAELEANEKPGVIERAKGWLFSGLGKEEGGRDGKEGASAAQAGVLAQVQALQAEREMQATEKKQEGGVLDRLGEAPPSSSSSSSTSTSQSESSKSWTSWLTTRR